MGYYRILYVGPIIRCVLHKQEPTIVKYMGCPTCKKEIKVENGLLFPPVCKKHKIEPVPLERIVHPKKIARYSLFDEIRTEFQREDDYDMLQRHVEGCVSGEIWLSPMGSAWEKRKLRQLHHEVDGGSDPDPVIPISDIDIETEKNIFREMYPESYKVLEKHFAKVYMDWGIVMDGS